MEAQKEDPLAVDQYAEVFCRRVGGEWIAAVEGTDPEHPLQTEFGESFVTFQGARTKYFDEYFTRAIDAGIKQVVLLAAGLDSRAYRLPWADGTVVYELDQPQVLEFKRETIDGLDDSPRAERREVAIDLRDDWPRALQDSGFDPARPSAWIAEGLLIYLPATAQEQLFAGIDALAAPGSFVGIEEAEPMPDEAFEAKRAEAAASDEENAFFTLVYNQQHEPAQRWFGSRGWDAVATPLHRYLVDVGRPVPAPDSEAGLMTGTITLVSATKR